MERPRRSAALDQWEVERSAFDPEALAARLVAAEPRDRDAAELLAAVPGTAPASAWASCEEATRPCHEALPYDQECRPRGLIRQATMLYSGRRNSNRN